MELILTRAIFSEKYTTGELSIPGGFFCYTMEDTDRGLQQQTPVADIVRMKALHPGETCIPYGKYEIAMTWSNRFQQVMPQLLHVPGFDGIRIHPGNTPEHTIGCILPGLALGIGKVVESKNAYSQLEALIREACAREKVFITITQRANV